MFCPLNLTGNLNTWEGSKEITDPIFQKVKKLGEKVLFKFFKKCS